MKYYFDQRIWACFTEGNCYYCPMHRPLALTILAALLLSSCGDNKDLLRGQPAACPPSQPDNASACEEEGLLCQFGLALSCDSAKGSLQSTCIFGFGSRQLGIWVGQHNECPESE